jgi:hypothetical protein
MPSSGILWILWASFLVGCHLLVPYSPPAADQGQLDQGRQDQSRAKDLAGRDSSVPDQRMIVLDAAQCLISPTVQVSSSCQKQNLQCLNAPSSLDPDCDGLFQSGDPWPAVCDKLQFSDEFTVPPQGLWDLSGSSSGMPAWSCGQIKLAAGTAITLKQLPKTIADAQYFVEVKFTLGKIVDPLRWNVGISAAYYETANPYVMQHRNCDLWLDPDYQVKPGLHSHLYALQEKPSCDSGSWTANSDVPAAAGSSYILQSWSDGIVQNCRLRHSDTFDAVINIEHSQCLPPRAGTIRLVANGREATVDYVRVYTF